MLSSKDKDITQEKTAQSLGGNNLRKLTKQQKKEELMNCRLFYIMYRTKHLFDDWHLDALIGIIPTAGDIVTALLSFPFINSVFLK